jgi:hypothetical protein
MVFGRGKAQKAAEHWQAQRDEYAELLQIAMTFNGSASSDLMLSASEALFYKVTGVSLIESRSTRGHYQGGSQGISIPIGSIGGRSVRYRVGSSRGHYVQGASVPTAIDHGTVYITNKRVIFAGAKQTRECSFAKLIGFSHDDRNGSTTFSVSNRQKPTTIHYGSKLSGAFDFRLDLALAHFRGTVRQLIGGLQAELARIDAGRPAAGVADPTPSVHAQTSEHPVATWLQGPGGQASHAVDIAVQEMEAAIRLHRTAPSAETEQSVIRAYDRVAEAVAAGLAAPPIPDGAAQTLSVQKLFSLQKAVTYFQAGTKATDDGLWNSGTESMKDAVRYATELMQRLRDLGSA